MPRIAAQDISTYVTGVGGRRLAEREWGLTVQDEWPIEIGIRLAAGLLRVQAYAVPAADAPDDSELLMWNRHTRLIRFGRAGSGDIWIHGDLPEAAATPDELDRLLGLVVEAVQAARAPEQPPGKSWLSVPDA